MHGLGRRYHRARSSRRHSNTLISQQLAQDPSNGASAVEIEHLGNRCAACNKPFRNRSQCPRQAYCTRTECQRERRRRWQRAKRLSDPDYKYNQKNAQHDWGRRNPNYWRQYREAHPKYCDRNRQKQTVRRRSKVGAVLVNLRSAHFSGVLPAGLYRMVPLRTRGRVAKMDFSDADVSWITVSIGVLRLRCKERMR